MGANSQKVRFESKRIFLFFSKADPARPTNFSITKICSYQHIICKISRKIYHRKVAIFLHFANFSYKISYFSLFMDRFNFLNNEK